MLLILEEILNFDKLFSLLLSVARERTEIFLGSKCPTMQYNFIWLSHKIFVNAVRGYTKYGCIFGLLVESV